MARAAPQWDMQVPGHDGNALTRPRRDGGRARTGTHAKATAATGAAWRNSAPLPGCGRTAHRRSW